MTTNAAMGVAYDAVSPQLSRVPLANGTAAEPAAPPFALPPIINNNYYTKLINNNSLGIFEMPTRDQLLDEYEKGIIKFGDGKMGFLVQLKNGNQLWFVYIPKVKGAPLQPVEKIGDIRYDIYNIIQVTHTGKYNHLSSYLVARTNPHSTTFLPRFFIAKTIEQVKRIITNYQTATGAREVPNRRMRKSRRRSRSSRRRR